MYNTGGYELSEIIRELRDTVDIYLTDFKYFSPDLAKRLSNAADYPKYAAEALKVMFENAGEPRFDEHGMLLGGVIVRHLVLPSHKDDSMACLLYTSIRRFHSRLRQRKSLLRTEDL